MTHIIGSGTAAAQDEAVYVTNFLSFGHLIPWGGLLDVRRLTPDEVKATFKGKKANLFAYPDLELMRDIVQRGLEQGGQPPQGSQEDHESAFCHMVNVFVEQNTGCAVHVTPKPKPVVVGQKHIFVQLYMPPATVIGAGGLGSVWWEITPKEIRAKPEAKTS